MITSRRSFLLGIGSVLAAPLVVKAEALMPVKRIITEDIWYTPAGYLPHLRVDTRPVVIDGQPRLGFVLVNKVTGVEKMLTYDNVGNKWHL